MRRENNRWIVNERIVTPLVIGAGGHFCPVARQLGARPGRGELAVTAQEIEFEMDAGQGAACRIRPERPELFFCSDMKGYGWCFRKGDYLNIGLGREGTHQLASIPPPSRATDRRRQAPRAHTGGFPWPCLSAHTSAVVA